MQTSIATKVVNVAGQLRLPMILDDAIVNDIYKWLSIWRFGPHDSTWRFTNSLQSKDLPLISRNKFYLGTRPGDGARSGYLCIIPHHKIVVFAENESRVKNKPPRVFLLRFRCDPYIWDTKGVIYSASLSHVDKKIIFEDMLMYKGRNTWAEDAFSLRWAKLQTTIQEDFFVDDELVHGMSIGLRDIFPINDIKAFGAYEFLPEQAARRRFLWIGSTNHVQPQPQPQQQQQPVTQKVESSIEIQVPAVKNASQLIATKGQFPDQYFLKDTGGFDYGMAVVVGLEVSKTLRQKTRDSVSVVVGVRPAENFPDKYEIVSVV